MRVIRTHCFLLLAHMIHLCRDGRHSLSAQPNRHHASHQLFSGVAPRIELPYASGVYSSIGEARRDGPDVNVTSPLSRYIEPLPRSSLMKNRHQR